MKQHSGMLPQDIVILLKIIALGNSPWRIIDVAMALGISQSEVSEALNRNMIAGLMDSCKPTVPRAAESDARLCEPLAPVDAVRIGKARERNLAAEEIKKRM
jgi:hypothetical protein